MNEGIACTYQRAKGFSIGAAILGLFGGAWMLFGLRAWGVSWAVAIAFAATGAVAAVAASTAIRRRLPHIAVPESPERRRRDRWFHIINGAQWIAIIVMANVLQHLGLGAWVMWSIALIVGLHFLPLTWVFGTRHHLWTGVAMIASVLGCAFLPEPARDAAVCTAAGITLWVSVLFWLRQGFALVRQLGSAPLAPAH